MLRIELCDDGRITVQEITEKLTGPVKEISASEFVLAFFGIAEDLEVIHRLSPFWDDLDCATGLHWQCRKRIPERLVWEIEAFDTAMYFAANWKNPYATPFRLPPNLVHYAWLKDTHLYVLFHEESVVDYRFYNDVFRVPMPPLLMAVKVDKEGKIQHTYLVAVDWNSRNVGPRTKVYAFPYAHANPNASGMVCWGQTKLPLIKTPWQLRTLPALFLSSEANHDYAGNNRSGMEFRQMLNELVGKATFPREWLLPLPEKNAENWIKRLGSPI